MIQGDSKVWLGHLIDIEECLLERIAHVWPTCQQKISTSYSEDQISNTLVVLLRKDQLARKYGAIHLQLTLPEEEPRVDQIKGNIDIAVVLNNDPDLYVAFECKRLNAPNGAYRSSLAGPYAEEGVIRYVVEQYADFLPMGAMLGYVYDGDTPHARTSIKKAIEDRAKMLNYDIQGGWSDLKAVYGYPRFSTTHRRSRGGNIEVRHSLLPVPRDT